MSSSLPLWEIGKAVRPTQSGQHLPRGEFSSCCVPSPTPQAAPGSSDSQLDPGLPLLLLKHKDNFSSDCIIKESRQYTAAGKKMQNICFNIIYIAQTNNHRQIQTQKNCSGVSRVHEFFQCWIHRALCHFGACSKHSIFHSYRSQRNI